MDSPSKDVVLISSLREWFDHPLTKLFREQLEKRNVNDQANFLVHALSLHIDSGELEKKRYILSGKREVIKNITDFDWIRDVLLEDKIK